MELPSFRLGMQPLFKNSDSEAQNSVFILSDSGLIREALAASLQQRLNSTHIHCIASFAEAVTRLDIAEPGMVLIDSTLRDGLSATKWLHLRDPVTRLIAFNIDDATQDVVAWTKAGIVACVHRSASLGEIIEQIVIATTGETIASGSAVTFFRRNTQDTSSPFGGATDRQAGILTAREEVGRLIVAGESNIVTAITGETIAHGSAVTFFRRNTQDASSPFGRATDNQAGILTAREEEVVARLIVAGESNKDIAHVLSISVPTVKSHVHSLLVKLGL